MFTYYTLRNCIVSFVFLINYALFSQNEKRFKEIDSLKTILQQHTLTDTLTAYRMNKLARLLSREMELEPSEYYAQKALKISQKINYRNGEAAAYNNIGLVYIPKSQYDKALNNLFLGLEKWEESGNNREIAFSHIQIGNVYDYQAKFPEALNSFFAALNIFEKIGETKGIAMAYSSIGTIFLSQAKYPESLDYYGRAFKKYEEFGDKYGISQYYNNVGIIYEAQGKHDVALEGYFKAIDLKKEIGDKQGLGGTYLNVSAIYEFQGDLQKSLEYNLACLEIMQEIGDKWGIAQAYSRIGFVEMRLDQFASAKKHSEEALKLAKEIGVSGLLRDVYHNSSVIDSAIGNFKGAYLNYMQFVVYRDSIINEENEMKSLEAAMGYEYDKKAAVIKAELKTKNLQRNVAFAGFGVMLLLVGLVIYFFKLRGKKLKVEKQNLELQRKEVQIIKENEQFKTRFLANISHEFRTPLTLINGHVEVLKENGRREDFSHFNEIEQNGKRLLSLINQLLDLSKMESGQYKLEYKKANVLHEANMLVQSFHSYAEQHGISLLLHHTENVNSLAAKPFVYSSEALAIIITNLVSNAIKYTPFGGSVTVEMDYSDHKLKVTISDTGEGIAVEHLPKIFERFYQVDEPGQRAYAGSGIGLALVKELVQLHGGDIAVESPIEGGCIFTFSIESAEIATVESVDSMEQNIVLPVKEEMGRINSENQNTELPLLLIIEDQPELRSFIVKNLGSEYRYEEASNGKDGMRLAKELLPDLIISDVMMPDVNGFELCETLKKEVATSHIPIILLTAKADQKDKLTGLEIGADDYLTKPFSLQELKLRVKNILAFKEQLRKKFRVSGLPTAEETPELSSRDRKFVDDVTKLVEEHISNLQFGVTILAEGVFLSVSQLTRKLKTITGKTPADFIRTIRLEKAIELLKKNESIADVAWAVGFEDSVYFSKVFKKHFGFPPSSVKR